MTKFYLVLIVILISSCKQSAEKRSVLESVDNDSCITSISYFDQVKYKFNNIDYFSDSLVVDESQFEFSKCDYKFFNCNNDGGMRAYFVTKLKKVDDLNLVVVYEQGIDYCLSDLILYSINQNLEIVDKLKLTHYDCAEDEPYNYKDLLVQYDHQREKGIFISKDRIIKKVSYSMYKVKSTNDTIWRDELVDSTNYIYRINSNGKIEKDMQKKYIIKNYAR